MAGLKWLSILCTAGLCASCAVFAPEVREGPDLPDRFSLYTGGSPAWTNGWWESFQSPELDTLMDEALAESPSIQQAWARFEQADAVARKAGAARWPVLDAEGAARADRNSLTKRTAKHYSVGLNASYELDLWGRIKSATEAAQLDRAASREQLGTVAVSLSSQVAIQWAAVVAQRLQTDVIRQQLEANQTSLELVELRFRKSLATALDVYQQRQAVASSRAQIPLAEMREQLYLNELAILVGRADSSSLTIQSAELPVIGALPPVGIPAEVLADRPDVRAAGLRLQAADWTVSAARADRLPSLRLTGSADYANTKFSDLLDDWYLNLLGSLTGPIFEGGRRKAEVDRVRAVANERLAAYRETVLTAIREVEDALVSERKQREYLEELDRSLALSRNSYDEALNRYRNGLSEYLPVLVELVQLQTLERDRVAAQYTLVQYRIQLYRALGGAGSESIQRMMFEREEA
jgi:NodT family efflux transporter outer membrane factor (OMF) lipoprotein